MTEPALKTISDRAEQAHARAQAEDDQLNPIISLRRGMRDAGIPADAMTIDCMRTRRRILLVLHDERPGQVLYQFTSLEEEAGDDFQEQPLEETSVEILLRWMLDYFSGA